MGIGDRLTTAVTTTATNIDFNADGGAVLVDLNIASSWDGTVDFQATLNGTDYFNIRYLTLGTLDPAESVSQLTSLSTARYLLPGPLTQVRINCGAGTTGTLTATYRIVLLSSNDLGVRVSGDTEHDSPDGHSPVKIGYKATNNISNESDVAANDRVDAAGTLKGAQIIAHGVASIADAATGYVLSLDEADDEYPIATGPYGKAPDGAADPLRTLGDTAGAGLGVLAVGSRTVNSSEVKTVRSASTASTTAAILISPDEGVKIRILSVRMSLDHATGATGELYFGDGANISTNAGNEIDEAWMDLTDQPTHFASWPDGGGPIGDATEDVMLRSNGSAGILRVIVVYREE